MRRLGAFFMAVGASLIMFYPVPADAQADKPGTCATPSDHVNVVTVNNAFDKPCYASPADAPLTITLRNDDPFAHNMSIYSSKGGQALFTGAYVPKASIVDYTVPPLPAGAYYYQCDIHPFMNGKFAAGVDASTPIATGTESTRAPKGLQVTLQKVADGFVAPVFVTGADDGTKRLFVVDQVGRIYIIDKHGKKLRRPFLDVGDELVKQDPNYDERGLLGLAFHPDFERNRRFYVWYNAPLRPGAPAGWSSTIHLSEFKASAKDPNVADRNSERVLMTIDHPQANHNSGHIAFGPDGFLYAPLGDGGNANDVGLGHTVPQGNAQDLTNIFGDILRIDVDHASAGRAYAIPNTNPYADGRDGAQPEIYANGFRNPYHISFDAGGGHQLYAADSGQDRFEEVDRVKLGGNYGWHIREGKHCFSAATPASAPPTCPDTGVGGTRLVDPLLEYNHTQILGSVVIGGYVYRGKRLPALDGMYVFGDYSRDRLKPDGEIFSAATTGPDAWKQRELEVTLPGDKDKGMGFGNFVLAFGQDDARELYVSLTSFGGPKGSSAGVYRFTAATVDPAKELADESAQSRTDAWYWLPLIAALGGVVTLLGFGVVRGRA